MIKVHDSLLSYEAHSQEDPCCCDITADWSMVPTTAWIQSPYVVYWARAYIDTVVALSDMNGAQYNVQPYVQCVTQCMYV